ncbi:MAG: DNA repair protein RecO [Deltaproteobacteria bacterium]|nr:DNA repair protein RecO [Deltaproteobacteria bacterium]
MEFSERVIVLKTGRFREQDMWVRLLSPTQGVVTAFAFGGCRSRRRFCGCLNSLGHVLFRMRRGRMGHLNLEEGVLLDGFPGIKADASRMGMAGNCCLFLQAAHEGGPDSSKASLLLLGVLEALESVGEVSWLLPLFFRAGLAFSQGYEPDFERCATCGRAITESPQGIFQVREGKMLCPACNHLPGPSVTVPVEAALLLARLGQAEPREWASWHPVQAVRQGCFQMIEALVQCHLGLAYKNNRYVRC